MKYLTTIDDKEYLVEILDEKHVSVDGKVLDVDFSTINGQRVFSLIIDGKSYELHVNPSDEGWEVLLRGKFYTAQVEDEREKRLRVSAGGRAVEGGEYHLKAPMPGLVVAVMVEDGMKIEKGQVSGYPRVHENAERTKIPPGRNNLPNKSKTWRKSRTEGNVVVCHLKNWQYDKNQS